MTTIFYTAAALLVWILAITVYQLATAFVATRFGIRVREISVGVGPAVFTKVVGEWTFRFAILPLGGYTQFHSHEDTLADEAFSDDALGSYRAATPLAQMLIVVSGPVTVLVLGLACLAVPVWAGEGPLEVCSPAETLVRPCGVGGLKLGDEPATWQSQRALFRDTGVELAFRIVTFQSLEGRGALIAFFATIGPIGELTFTGWLSSLGVLLVWFGAFNLLPVPILNGFHFLLAFGRALTGRELPESTRFAMTYVGLLVVLLFSVRVAWADLSWVWAAWRAWS